VINGWLHLTRGVNPAPVQVDSGKVASGVAVDDPVGVEHGHHLEDEVVSQDLGVQTWPCEVVEDTLHHPAGTGLARMDPRRDADALPILDGIGLALERCDHQHVAVVARDCLAQGATPHTVLALGVRLQNVEVPLKVSVSIGITMREVDSVLVMLEAALPGQGVVVPRILSLHRVLVVADVTSCSDPPTPRLLGGGLGVHQWPHAMIIERVWLDEVDNIEPIILSSLRVGHAEVVPLSVASRVVIWLQDQVILILVDLNGSAQIATFEPGFEQESVVIGALGHVEWGNLTLWSLALLIW
jgi:hypothetical protein